MSAPSRETEHSSFVRGRFSRRTPRTFQAKDGPTLREFVIFAHNLWAAPLTAAGCIVLLLRVLGPSALVGVVLIPVLVPFETWVARR